MEKHAIMHLNIVRWHPRDVPFIPPDMIENAEIKNYRDKWATMMNNDTSANHLTKKGQLEVIKKLKEVL